ncbi:50S ribosomal protein L6, partial [Acinetobacter baumannii]
MSRVAKKPVALPKGVEVSVQDESITVKGPKGTLTQAKPAAITLKLDNGTALFETQDEALVPLTGTLRAILANMVE